MNPVAPPILLAFHFSKEGSEKVWVKRVALQASAAAAPATLPHVLAPSGGGGGHTCEPWASKASSTPAACPQHPHQPPRQHGGPRAAPALLGRAQLAPALHCTPHHSQPSSARGLDSRDLPVEGHGGGRGRHRWQAARPGRSQPRRERGAGKVLKAAPEWLWVSPLGAQAEPDLSGGLSPPPARRSLVSVGDRLAALNAQLLVALRQGDARAARAASAVTMASSVVHCCAMLAGTCHLAPGDMGRCAASASLVLKSGAAALDWAARNLPSHGRQAETLELLGLQAGALLSFFVTARRAEQQGDVAAASAASAAVSPHHFTRWLAVAAGLLNALESLRGSGEAPTCSRQPACDGPEQP